jgi:hypothetical protein
MAGDTVDFAVEHNAVPMVNEQGYIVLDKPQV